MSMDRSVFSFRSARGSASAELKNTPRFASCKRSHGAHGTNKLPVSKHTRRARQQHFDSPHGFIGATGAQICICAQKFFAIVRPKVAVLPYFSGPGAIFSLSLYVSAYFLARIST